jgi:hypothetical protein
VFVRNVWTKHVNTLDIDLNETVQRLKRMVCTKTMHAFSIDRLILDETVLHDEQTLASYRVASGSTILLVPR